jgi:PPOX class probable F420-dependent enzyme
VAAGEARISDRWVDARDGATIASVQFQQLSQDHEMPSTTIPRGLEDLLDAKVASLTTLGRSGDPQATLVWFAYNRELARFQLSLSDDRVKVRNLIARPKVSLLIFDPADQFRYLDVRGTARTEPDEGFAWADAFITPKYGADVRNFPGANRLVVTIEPQNIFSQNGAG